LRKEANDLLNGTIVAGVVSPADREQLALK
jgi:hypothetical protein